MKLYFINHRNLLKYKRSDISVLYHNVSEFEETIGRSFTESQLYYVSDLVFDTNSNNPLLKNKDNNLTTICQWIPDLDFLASEYNFAIIMHEMPVQFKQPSIPIFKPSSTQSSNMFDDEDDDIVVSKHFICDADDDEFPQILNNKQNK